MNKKFGLFLLSLPFLFMFVVGFLIGQSDGISVLESLGKGIFFAGCVVALVTLPFIVISNEKGRPNISNLELKELGELAGLKEKV